MKKTPQEMLEAYVAAVHQVALDNGFSMTSVATLTNIVRAYIIKYQPPENPGSTTGFKQLDREEIIKKMAEVPLFTARPKNVIPINFKKKTESK